MVKDPKLLRKNYAKTIFFYLDIISILPTDITYFFLETKCYEKVPCLVIGKIFVNLKIGIFSILLYYIYIVIYFQ